MKSKEKKWIKSILKNYLTKGQRKVLLGISELEEWIYPGCVNRVIGKDKPIQVVTKQFKALEERGLIEKKERPEALPKNISNVYKITDKGEFVLGFLKEELKEE